MKKYIFLCLFLCFNLVVRAQQVKPVDAIKPYCDFLKNCHTNPVDYVMGLFDKYDIVVLGERSHRDTTQYDLIGQIISDPRFIEKVGNIYTEVGVYNMTDTMNRILNAGYDTFGDFEKEMLRLCRDMDFEPIWNVYNFRKLLVSVYHANKGLPVDKKLHMVFTDLPFRWENCPDKATYQVFDRFCDDFRDEIMANNAITELYKLFAGNSSRKKALIIYNRPHSYRYYDHKNKYSMAAQYIFDRFPGRVANVMMNWCKLNYDPYKGTNFLIQDGKWDAAFYLNDNKSVGFDLAESPFGNDLFDHYAKPKTKTFYKDIYTGFIFYKPVYEWINANGYHGEIVDKGFTKEMIRREFLSGNYNDSIFSSQKFSEDMPTWYNRLRVSPVFSDSQKADIMRWIHKYIH